jgi:DNA polymerase-3 subunit gamma/tau
MTGDGSGKATDTDKTAAGKTPASRTPASRTAGKTAASKTTATKDAGTGKRARPTGQRAAAPAAAGVQSHPEGPIALYRRYRPATFAEVRGQEHVTEPLRQALRSGRVHHAYLFSGPRGCGKTSSARILARSLNCENGPTPDPCGHCASCVALAPTGPGSIDVIEIDAASHGGIDDARDLRERAFYSPVAARYKVYIIDEAHMVTGGGFNALLKLVEEPPPHLKFVFATTEPEKVIATIRSRTHHYPFRLLPPAVLRELLEEILAAEQVKYEPAVLPVVIRAGAGSARDSLSVLDQLIAGADEHGLRYDRAIALLGYTDDALLDEMADAFGAGNGAAVFRTVDRVVEAGHDPRRFAMDLLDRLRDLIVLAAVPDAGTSGLLEVPEDRLARMVAQAAGLGQPRLVRAAETISAGLVEMRGTTSPRLLLELMCAQVLLPERPPDSATDAGLTARVERLERQVGRARADSGSPAPRSDPPAPQRIQERQPQPQSVQPASPPRLVQAERPHATGTAPTDDTLRSRWPEVLESVRQVRKTAWMLLNSFATVESVNGNVLTLAFDREGNAKGFASSGSDGYLADVLAAMFGVPMVVRTTVRTGGSDSGGDPSRPAIPGRREPDPQDPVSSQASPATGPASRAPANGAPDAMGARDGLSGTDLIMRELGGRVIDDVGEA